MSATALDPKTALVVIDLQKGIAAYPTAHPMKDVIAVNVRLAEAFRAAGLPVVLVRVDFSPDGGELLRVRAEVQRTITRGPDFAVIVPELGPKENDVVVTKHQPNAFFGTDLDVQLRRRGVTGIVLTGVSTSIGVEATARAANERAYNITFPTDAITDMDPASHEHVFAKIFPRLGEIDSSDAILKLVRRA